MEYLYVSLLSICAGIIQALTGFGAGVVLMLILPYFYNMLQAPAITQFICTVLNIAIIMRFRKSLQFKKILIPTLFYLVFTLLAIEFAKGMNLKLLSFVFGIFLVLLAIYFFFFSKRAKLKNNYITAISSSTVSGICSGLFGIGGPTMALYMVSTTDSREEYLANLQMLFIISNIPSTVMRFANHILTVNLIPIIAVGGIAIVLGEYIGSIIGKKIDGDRFKPVVYSCVAVSGIILAIQNIP